MPYIDKSKRAGLLTRAACPITAGELNFLLTTLCLEYWHELGPNYQTINDILGALEGAKQEFYRRVAVPYEEQKIKDNGDVYP